MIILGLDSAWTSGEPSGVALVARKAGTWRCLCAAPSYDAFVKVASGEDVDWRHGKFSGTAPNIAVLLAAAQAKAGERVSVVAVDMPLSRRPFSGRRAADDAISVEFSSRWCSTHSPSAGRPGPISTLLTQDLADAGYLLATAEHTPGPLSAVLEVYPHPALLGLLNSPCRIPYKVGNSTRYWPGTTVQKRIANLLQQFALIEGALRRMFGETHIPLPLPGEVTTLSQLKRYEDALDALVCAWVGVSYIEGSASAYGDGTAAIWVPQSSTDPHLSPEPHRAPSAAHAADATVEDAHAEPAHLKLPTPHLELRGDGAGVRESKPMTQPTTEMPQGYSVKTCSPADLTAADLDRCAKIIIEGGSIENRETVKEWLPRSVVLAVVWKGEEIVGVGAIKPARPSYAERVARESEHAFPNDAPELGYIARDPAHHGKGFSPHIVSALLARHAAQPLWATTSSGTIKAVLTNAGFKHAGKEWDGRHDRLSLWLSS